MEILMTILMMPLMILNLLGGIVSGIWLIVLGEWRMIFLGICFLFVSHWIISIALMPGMLLVMPAMLAIQKGKKVIGSILGSLNILYTMILITIWCLYIMAMFVNMASDKSIVPALIWSYGVALGPWMYLAQKDQLGGGGSSFSAITTLLAQIAYITTIIMFFFGASAGSISKTFGAIMLIAGMCQIVFTWFLIGSGFGQTETVFSEDSCKEATLVSEKTSRCIVCSACNEKNNPAFTKCWKCKTPLNSEL
jgi:hypothetical protein